MKSNIPRAATQPKPTIKTEKTNEINVDTEKQAKTTAPPRDTMTPEEIKALRKSLGLTQAEFAKLCGVKSHMNVYLWERGDRNPSGSAVMLMRQLYAQKQSTDFSI